MGKLYDFITRAEAKVSVPFEPHTYGVRVDVKDEKGRCKLHFTWPTEDHNKRVRAEFVHALRMSADFLEAEGCK